MTSFIFQNFDSSKAPIHNHGHSHTHQTTTTQTLAYSIYPSPFIFAPTCISPWRTKPQPTSSSKTNSMTPLQWAHVNPKIHSQGNPFVTHPSTRSTSASATSLKKKTPIFISISHYTKTISTTSTMIDSSLTTLQDKQQSFGTWQTT